MKPEIEVFLPRFRVFERDVLAPAVYPRSAPLQATALMTDRPLTADEARARPGSPVAIGWRWGPVWSTCWFHVSGSIPPELAGEEVHLRFSSGTEATVWTSAGPVRGLDVNRDAFRIAERATAGTPVDLMIEGACNHPWGVAAFEWDDPETHARWKSDTPGRFDRCELAAFAPDAWRLRRAYALAHQLLAELDPQSARARGLYAALRRATDMIDDRNVRETAQPALRVLREALTAPAGFSAPRCHAVGHAHIDTAWLWRLNETRRKTVRSFANALELMDRDRDFAFMCSQAQQYAWLEADAPNLFDRIRQRVAEGRWEPIGGMWVEPDCNCPSGESLLRQALHADRYWRDRFGDRGEQRVLFLPDTFGFPASLPGIMRAAGLDTFITNKMSWNQLNAIPLTTFRWRGIDGAEVMAHLTPGGDYNATCTARELRRGEANIRGTERGGPPVPVDYLQPFGYGDGGGGPTDWMIENVRLAEDCEGLPRTRLSTVREFREALRRADTLTDGGLPRWTGELYLELHRGTLTTQAWLKRANRRAEERLRLAEILLAAGPSVQAGSMAPACAALHDAWSDVLLNQFHDILPGSSIGEVYRDAHEQMERALTEAERICAERAPAFLGIDSVTSAVLNPASTERTGVVETPGGLTLVRAVPAVGVRALEAADPVRPVTATDDGVLANGVIEARIDRAGRIVTLRRTDGPDLADPGPLNRLVMYEDRPMMWDAWDIDLYHEDKPVWSSDPGDDTERRGFRILSRGPLRAEIEVRHRMGDDGVCVQTFRLDAESPRLDIRTRIEWRGGRRLLRAEFPTDLHADHVTCEIQFGHITRSTRRNTSWERAMFEFPAHRWVDLSEPGRGLSLLNDGKYGHSCHDGRLGLTLVRSPRHPDPDADVGPHEFTYGLMPHDGDWRAAGVAREAEAMNRPLRVVERAAPVEPWAPFEIDCASPAGVEVVAVKPAADDPGRLVVRLVEVMGARGEARIAWRIPVRAVVATDALERPLGEGREGRAERGIGVGGAGVDHDPGSSITRVPLGRFSIVTLLVDRA